MILMRKPRGREVCATRQWPRFECVSRVHGPGVYGLETPGRRSGPIESFTNIDMIE